MSADGGTGRETAKYGGSGGGGVSATLAGGVNEGIHEVEQTDGEEQNIQQNILPAGYY